MMTKWERVCVLCVCVCVCVCVRVRACIHTHLCALDDDRVRGEIHTPREGCGAHQHLNDAIRKHLFHHVTVRAEDPGIVAREPACEYK
jgi:hypothetical protein